MNKVLSSILKITDFEWGLLMNFYFGSVFMHKKILKTFLIGDSIVLPPPDYR